MDVKQKNFLIIITLIALFVWHSLVFALQVSDDKISIIYISDLNLYHTPSQSQGIKHTLEKKFGILIYESQAVFQEIIGYINQKLKPDIVIFGGNNIADEKKDENLWQLFLDMTSELKSKVFVNLGINEIKTYNTDELTYSLSIFGQRAKSLWYSQKIKNYLFINLNSVLLFNNSGLSREQLKWFTSVLSQNKNTTTVIALYHSLLDSEGNIINNSAAKKIIEIISANPQVKLVLSGGEYFNRTHLFKDCLFVNVPSPVVYPCSFKIVELFPGSIKIRTINIPLKGIVNKALKSAKEAEYFKTKASPNDVKSYLLGKSQDLQFDYVFSDLKNR